MVNDMDSSVATSTYLGILRVLLRDGATVCAFGDISGEQWTAGAEQRKGVALKVAPASVPVLPVSKDTAKTTVEMYGVYKK